MQRSPGTGTLGLVLAVLLAAWGQAAAQDPAAPSFTFLDAAAAAEAIVDDEGAPYFSRLRTLEMSAKTGQAIHGPDLAAQRAECRRRFAASTLDFTAEEIALVTSILSTIQPHLQRHYPRVAAPGWSLLKVSSQIEGGFPHTRGRHIVLPSKLLAGIARNRNRSAGEKLVALGGWLLHEQMHVVQRADPALFFPLYTEVWGFRRVDSVGDHPWLTAHRLTNPDGAAGYWIFPIGSGEETTWIWPTVVLGESRGVRRLMGVPSLTRDLRMIAVELSPAEDGIAIRLDRNGMPALRRLLSLQEYRGEFPFAAAPYGPNEIAAEGFARIVITEIAENQQPEPLRSKPPVEPRTRTLHRWFVENLD